MQLIREINLFDHPIDFIKRYSIHIVISRVDVIEGQALHLHPHKNVGNWPVAIKPQRVSAGEVNLTGPLTVRATAVGSDTSLHRMADLVAIAESGRSRYTSLADKAAKLYAPGVHILAALSFLGWLIWSGDIRISLNVAAAVLIITCPCALGLAVPAVTTAASGRMFRMGLLIKNATALERLAQVDAVVFDKTGTLTTGTPSLSNIDVHDDRDLRVALATGLCVLAKYFNRVAHDVATAPEQSL